MSHSPNEISARLILAMWASHSLSKGRSHLALRATQELPMAPDEAQQSVYHLLKAKGATSRQIKHLRDWFRLHGPNYVAAEFCEGVNLALDTFRLEVEFDVQEWLIDGRVKDDAEKPSAA